MVSTLERRVARLEQIYGSGSDNCPRCKDTVIVIDTSGGISVTRRGRPLPSEAARAFVLEEEPGGVCPLCGGVRERVRVRWGNQHDT